MKTSFDNVKIQGMAVAVPENVENNFMFSEQIGESQVKKQISFTGICKRHICSENQTILDLCEEAFREICGRLGWDEQSIDSVILVTQSPVLLVPSSSFVLHEHLGLKKECFVFDMNMGCAGFNTGLHTISSLLSAQPNGARGILLIVDDINRLIRGNCKELNASIISHLMLFGSAAAAVAVEHKESDIPMLVEEFSDGSRHEAIHLKKNEDFFMDGLDIFAFATSEVTDSVERFIEENKLAGQIDYYVFHQAEKAVLDEIQDILGLEDEKFLLSYSEYGNTSGASLPVTLCANKDRIKKKKIRVLFCGFGVGLSWGLAYACLDTENIMPIIEVV